MFTVSEKGRRRWFGAAVFGFILFLTALQASPAGAAPNDPYLVKDIWPGTSPSNPAYMTTTGDRIFFMANDGVNGAEVWATDGTAAGTALVRNIAPSGTSSNPVYFKAAGDRVFFQANDATTGVELWVSDGTSAGTALVKDIYPGTNSSYPDQFAVAGSRVFFRANEGTAGAELWVSDGTSAGTYRVKDIYPGASSSNIVFITPVGDRVFFRANNGTTGDELWVSNGTEAGTFLVMDINPGSAASGPYYLTAFNGQLYFAATDPTNGNELWVSDGTETGTVLVENIYSGGGSSYPSYLVVFGDRLYFNARDVSVGYELWVSDGTADGTTLFKDIWAGAGHSSPIHLTAAGSRLYFAADDGSTGRELWVSDGTAAGTMLVKDITPGVASNSYDSLTADGDRLFFRINDGVTGYEMWVSDGTAAGTALVRDINPGLANSSPTYLATMGGRAYFAATDAGGDRELWASDGTEAGTAVVKDIYASPITSNPYGEVLFDGRVFFSATDAIYGQELWVTDGTTGGTALFKDLCSGCNGSPYYLTPAGDRMYFRANNGANGSELWMTDGTPGNTTMVKDIWPGSNAFVQNLTPFAGKLYFEASNGANGVELMVSDGTVDGTMLVKDINPGSASSNPESLTVVGDQLFFRANDGANGIELWVSDGTEAGTTLVRDIWPGSSTSTPTNLIVYDNRLYFAANDGANGAELWVSDGTTAGTTMVKDVYPGSTYSSPTYLAVFGDRLYFAAINGTNGRELWVSDGTTDGTTLFKDINPGSVNSSPIYLTAAGDRLYFQAYNGSTGYELWASDGTAAGTALVKDIYTGSPSSQPIDLKAAGNLVYFKANDGSHGYELWVSDGTAAGTTLLEDIYPGSGSSSPANIALLAGKLYFAATAPVYGTELWALDAPAGLTIVKEVIGGPATWSFAFTGDLAAFDLTDTNVRQRSTYLDPGSYTVSETALDHYTSSVACSSGETGSGSVTVNLAAGEAVICTFTNTFLNDPPTADDKTATTDEDTPVGITLSGSDIDGDALTFTVVDEPEHGTLSGDAPELTYTPAANYNGADSFTYKANDGTADSAVATVSITINAANDPPVAHDKTATTDEDTPTGITLTGIDLDGDTLTFAIVDEPAHGTLSGDAPDLTYTPAANYNGADSFTYKANDGTADSAVATVSITINAANDPPVAHDKTATTDEDAPIDITLSGSDIDADTLTFTIVEGPLAGTLSGTPPNVTYTPNANDYGSDSFTYKANDGTDDSNVANVAITINAANDPPVADDKAATTDEDTPVAITLSGSDIDGDTLTFMVVEGPSAGVLSGTPPAMTYTPNANDFGSDSFTYKADDGTADSSVATVSITINAANDPPVAHDKAATTDEDTPVAITLSGSDLDGDTLTFTIVDAPEHGTLSGDTPDLTYTPAASYNGTDSFTYKANDGTADSSVATVAITINAANDPPVAHDKAATTDEDIPVGITLTGSDIDGDSLTFSIADEPTHGTLSGTPPSVTYTPAANYNGEDSFTYTASDGTVDSATATVSITIDAANDPPVADDKTATTDEDTPVGITLTGSDIDGDSLTFSIADEPTHGTLSGTPPSVTYTPAANYNGEDSFTYTASDGTADSSVATVSITINAANDPPVAHDKAATTDEDTPVGITLSGSDTDGDSLAFTIVDAPEHGTLSGDAPDLTYTPAADYNGADSFTYKANDGTVDSATATASITINAANDPPVAHDKTAMTDEDTPVDITLSGGDIDGDSLTFNIVEGPSAGALSGTPPSVTYTPAANYNGPDSFTYKANDGTAPSSVATVSITIAPANDPPVAHAKTATTDEDTPVGITLSGSDYEGDALTFTLVGEPLHGILSGVAPAQTYTPAADYHGSDSFSYRAFDGEGYSGTATVSITVSPVNDPPTSDNKTVTTDENKPFTITLTGDDIDGDSLSFTIVDGPSAGTLSGTPPTVTYTPNTNYFGNDSFTYMASDAVVDSNIAMVNITINRVNEPPVAADDAYTVDEDAPTLVVDKPGVLGNDTDPDGDPLTTVLVDDVDHGELALNSDGSFVYSPELNYNGPDSFTYQANDGMKDSDVVAVAITVTPVNDPPMADDQAAATNEDTAIDIALTGSDIDSASLTFAVVDAPAHGALSADPPNLTYTPALDYNGPDSFTFVANDGSVDSNVATVSITINPVNDPPVVAGQTATTDEDTPVAITLAATDVDSAALTFSVVDEPANGALSGDAPNLAYKPALNYNGPDSFTFQAFDGEAYSTIATVDITVNPVNDPPVANDDSASTDEDVAVEILVLANDADVDDGDTLAVIAVSDPPHGAATTYGATVTYTPDLDYNSPAGAFDSFTYTISDGHGGTATASVDVVVGALNDAPVAVADEAVTDEDTPVMIDVLANDSDVDGNLDPATTTIIVDPSHGSAVVNTDATITYSPEANYNGPDGFTYRVCDAYPVCVSAEVSLTVQPVNDPPAATGQEVTTNEDAPLAITLVATDVDPDALTYAIVGSPAHGVLSGDAPELTYTPAANYHGSDSFTFVANDGLVDSNEATVSITVAPVNDPPVVAWTTLPAGPAMLNAAVPAVAVFNDVDSGDNHTCAWDWGDGTVEGPAPCSAGTISGSHVYTAVGAYIVTFTVTDNNATVQITAGVSAIWSFTGFLPPVDNPPVLNSIKAGNAVPVKFSLGGDYGLTILAAGYPKSIKITCDSGAPVDTIEETVTAGSSNLQYDPLTGRYTYVWKTDKKWTNTCRQFQLMLADGTLHLANFKFK